MSPRAEFSKGEGLILFKNVSYRWLHKERLGKFKKLKIMDAISHNIIYRIIYKSKVLNQLEGNKLDT